jgi:hypothetical protein
MALAGRTAIAGPPGFSVAVGGGVNVGTPFIEAQVGRRFEAAKHFELYLDYSYDAAISEFSFQTFGLGARTYLASFGRFELFHQALAGFAVSSGGEGPVSHREIGERLLGPVFTQGVGAEVLLYRGLTATLVVSTGYPVWLRPELTVKYRF